MPFIQQKVWFNCCAEPVNRQPTSERTSSENCSRVELVFYTYIIIHNSLAKKGHHGFFRLLYTNIKHNKRKLDVNANVRVCSYPVFVLISSAFCLSAHNSPTAVCGSVLAPANSMALNDWKCDWSLKFKSRSAGTDISTAGII